MLVLTVVGCGAPQPYERIPGKPIVAAMRVDVDVSGRGLRLAAVTRCRRSVREDWCHRMTQPSCFTDREEDVDCPPGLGLRNVQVSVRSPWGRTLGARSNAAGVAEVPIDWAATGIDPLEAGAAERLATGWVLQSDELRAVPLKIVPADAERIRSAIGVATDTQYEVGAINEKAALSAELTEGTLVVGRPGSLALAVTNGGPQPAYRVIAKLQSSVAALHGHQISFGRIDPGKTKIRKQVVALPLGLDDRSALVVAQISYFNGERLETKARFDIKPELKGSDRPPGVVASGSRVESPRGLAVVCQLATAEVAPGERVRLDCELRNLGSELLAQVGLQVSVGGFDSENQAPMSLPGAGSVKLELVGLSSPRAKQGTRVPVFVRATAQGVPGVEQVLSVAIVSFAARCTTRLTRAEYKVKQKRLQAALNAGALTQKEFDKYDADLVSCLQ